METNQLVSRGAASGVASVSGRANPTRAAINNLLKSALKRQLGGSLGGVERTIARIEEAARSGEK